jgi:hypothetical protein
MLQGSNFVVEYTFKAPLEHFENNLYGHHIKVDGSVVSKFSESNDRRVIVLLNGILEKPCAIMPHPESYYIIINQDERRKLRIALGDMIEVQMQKDRSEYGMPLPEEFEVVMENDPSGKAYFHELTPGKQRSLIYLVLKVKNTDSRISKSLAIFHHLNEVRGQLDFKLLHDTIKTFNQQRRQGF